MGLWFQRDKVHHSDSDVAVGRRHDSGQRAAGREQQAVGVR